MRRERIRHTNVVILAWCVFQGLLTVEWADGVVLQGIHGHMKLDNALVEFLCEATDPTCEDY